MTMTKITCAIALLLGSSAALASETVTVSTDFAANTCFYEPGAAECSAEASDFQNIKIVLNEKDGETLGSWTTTFQEENETFVATIEVEKTSKPTQYYFTLSLRTLGEAEDAGSFTEIRVKKPSMLNEVTLSGKTVRRGSSTQYTTVSPYLVLGPKVRK